MPNLHTRNPLRNAAIEGYFDLERSEVIPVLANNKAPTNRIIEIGCGSGATGAAIKKNLPVDHYVGIELNEQAAERARQQIDQVIVADLQKSSPQDLGIAENDFDVLLALDVLEHLYDPWDVLADWARVIRPGGRAILSIPNTQNIDLITRLVHGQFQYENAGLRDVTHIRFFTASTVVDLIEGAGLKILTADRILIPALDMNQIRDNDNTLHAGKMTLSQLTREEVIALSVWQFIITAERPSEPAA